ncbi:hypothetical protein ANRL4_00869 [Anaerolineae bacterium]|nr:hypothetical protein ANRL4_00869 [Anaerolineae bacterium]
MGTGAAEEETGEWGEIVSDWREYEFKAMFSDLPPIEQGETIGVIVARWIRRQLSQRRIWVVNEVYPVVYVLGNVSVGT